MTDGTVDPSAVAAGIGLVAGIAQVVKVALFPAGWQNGRAVFALVAILAIAVVIAAQLQSGGSLGDDPLGLAATWLAVYTGAIGAHQTVTKIGNVAANTTNPTGPDDIPTDRDDLARP